MGDAIELTVNALEKTAVLQIRQVAFRFVAAKAEIELQLDWISGNPQVFKACAQERNFGNVAVHQRVLSGNLGHHTIGSDYIAHIESLEHRRRLRHPARVIRAPDILLVLELAAGHTSVAHLE